jgi:hypothetical protein
MGTIWREILLEETKMGHLRDTLRGDDYEDTS